MEKEKNPPEVRPAQDAGHHEQALAGKNKIKSEKSVCPKCIVIDSH